MYQEFSEKKIKQILYKLEYNLKIKANFKPNSNKMIKLYYKRVKKLIK